jgi:threonine/homoserine/homoserine lactone efflux protein
MDPTAALVAGLTVGLLIAIQVGPISLLVVETAVVAGRRAGVAAGMGVASADLTFAALAAGTGGAAGAALAGREHEIRIAGAILLAAIAARGLAGLVRGGAPGGADDRGRSADGAETGVAAGRRALAHYGRFLAITMANPLTIVSFGAAAGALSLDGVAAAGGFVTGVGAASAAWHAALGTAAGHAARWMTPRGRRVLALGGRVAILGLAAHLALTA